MPFAGHRSVAQVDAGDQHFAEVSARIKLVSDRPGKFFVAPIGPDRTPCPWCGVRGDISCSHRKVA